MHIQDKIAVITGAGSAIGRATALRLAREGGRVVAAEVDTASARDTVARITSGGGGIVQTSSLAGLIGWGPDPIYAATKAALALFTHSLAHLSAEAIRGNCICPSGVNTPMLARPYESATAKPPEDMPLLKPEDIADGFVQLITDDALAGRTLLIGHGLRDFAPLPPLPIN